MPVMETKIPLGDVLPESDSDFHSNSQAFASKTLPEEKVEKVFAMDKMNRYFRKELQFEHDINNPSSEIDDDEWIGIDLFDPKLNKATLLCTGPNYQAEIPTFNLHKKSMSRDVLSLLFMSFRNKKRYQKALESSQT